MMQFMKSANTGAPNVGAQKSNKAYLFTKAANPQQTNKGVRQSFGSPGFQMKKNRSKNEEEQE